VHFCLKSHKSLGAVLRKRPGTGAARRQFQSLVMRGFDESVLEQAAKQREVELTTFGRRLSLIHI